MIETLKNFPENIVAFHCGGHVTRRDYETILIPHVEQTLAKHERIRLYYEIGTDFTGMDPGAMWADFKVGVEHLLRWERVAVITDIEWIRRTMSAFSFLVPGDVKLFTVSDASKARDWITES